MRLSPETIGIPVANVAYQQEIQTNRHITHPNIFVPDDFFFAIITKLAMYISRRIAPILRASKIQSGVRVRSLDGVLYPQRLDPIV
jgi:hypothetical protein